MLLRGMFFVIACLTVVMTAQAESPEEVLARHDVYCPLDWSADGSQVTQKSVSKAELCDFDAKFDVTRADFELKMLCHGYDCTHESEMKPRELAHYRALETTPKVITNFPYNVCLINTPDYKVVRVAGMYLSNNNGQCDERNVVRVYYPDSNKVCLHEGGCIPLQYVDGEGSEYRRLVQPLMNGALPVAKKLPASDLHPKVSSKVPVEPPRPDRSEEVVVSKPKLSHEDINPPPMTPKKRVEPQTATVPLPQRKPDTNRVRQAQTAAAKPSVSKWSDSPAKEKKVGVTQVSPSLDLFSIFQTQ